MVSFNNKNSGYTIIETMIFLAVSALIFLIAVDFISGKQSNTEASVSLVNFETQFQQAIKNSLDGYYNNTGNFSCSATSIPSSGSPSTNISLTFSSSSTAVGQNQYCTLLGDAFVFKLANTDVSSGNGFSVIPIAGSNYYYSSSLGLQPLTNINQTSLYPLDPIGTNTLSSSQPIDLTSNYLAQFGLTIQNIYLYSGSSASSSPKIIDGFVILTSINGNFNSSEQGSNVYYLGSIPPLSNPITESNVNSQISNLILPPRTMRVNFGSGSLPSNDAILVCVLLANNQPGDILIGQGGNIANISIGQGNNVNPICSS